MNNNKQLLISINSCIKNEQNQPLHIKSPLVFFFKK
jgi:hypothetical protein